MRQLDRTHIAGDVVECGVAAGGSAALLGAWLTRHPGTRQLHLFDTFEGLPAPTENDPDYDRAVEWTGKCLGTLEQVRALMERQGVALSRVTFVPGLFQNTIPALAPDHISLLHLDGDWYDSTKWCLDHLWQRVSPGGRVQIDDYGTWQGCRKATDEFLAVQSDVRVRPIDDAIWLEKLGH